MKIKFDARQLEKSYTKLLNEYGQFAQKSAPEIANKKMKDVLIKALRYIPVAVKAKIKETLETNGLVYKLIKKTGLKRAEIEAKAKRMISKAMSSAQFIKAGFYKALVAFGGRGGKTKSGGLADQGKGVKATRGKALAVSTNFATGAPQVAHDAVMQALEESRKDTLQYVQRKHREFWKRARR